MTGESAVTSMSERSTYSLIFFRLGLVPSTRNLRKFVQLSHDRYRVSDVEDHQRRFALGRVNLARHDGGAWLVLWDLQFAKSGTRAAGHQPNVIGNLVERDCECAHRSRQLHQCIVSTLHRELIRGSDKGQAGELGDLGS